MDGLKLNDPKTNAFFDAEIVNEFDHLCESWWKTGILIAIDFVEAKEQQEDAHAVEVISWREIQNKMPIRDRSAREDLETIGYCHNRGSLYSSGVIWCWHEVR